MTDPIIFKPQFVGPPSIPTKQADNNAITHASMGMPFKPINMTQGSSLSRERNIYANMLKKPENKLIPGPCTFTSNPFNTPSRLLGLACNRKKVNEIEYYAKKTLLANQSSSDVTAKRKAAAIGKGTGMRMAPTAAGTSFKRQDKNTVNSALARCRNKGYVSPPKKSAIQNLFKGSGCCK